MCFKRVVVNLQMNFDLYIWPFYFCIFTDGAFTDAASFVREGKNRDRVYTEVKGNDRTNTRKYLTQVLYIVQQS